MSTHGKLLQLNIGLMKFVNMWPEEGQREMWIARLLRDMSAALQVIMGLSAVSADFIQQCSGQYDNIMDITENLTAIGAMLGSLYIVVCFVQNRKIFMKLINKLPSFEEFCPHERMLETEKKAVLLTKLFMAYGLIGNLMYVVVPYVNLTDCKEKRSHYKYAANMPCELIVRIRIPFAYENNWWTIQLVVLWQFMVCSTATYLMLSVTLFLLAILMQVITQLQQLQVHIKNDIPVKDCIRHHIAIIDFAKEMAEAFSSTMLMFITLASFEISMLGFETVMVNSMTTSFRYALHLLGWIVILFLVCSYGQQLIDESTGVGQEVYASSWYNKSVSEQKTLRMMIMRSQKPLILNAASFGTLSLETFLNVLSTAYSYFTLLLNVKES